MKVTSDGWPWHPRGRHGYGQPEMYKNAMQVGQKAQVATLGL
jgi:hypothetical protein